MPFLREPLRAWIKRVEDMLLAGTTLPQELQNIIAAGDPDTEGQALTFDGDSIIWGTPEGGGGEGSGLTGNPFIDNWGTPDAEADDEFNDGGSPNLADRDWEVWNLSDNVSMSRVGPVSAWDGALGTGQYRSSLVGSYLSIQIPQDKTVAVVRNVTPLSAATNYTLYARVGVPTGLAIASGNGADTTIKGSAEIQVVRSNAGVGVAPQSGGAAYNRFCLGTTRYYWTDGNITTIKNINADSFTPANLSQVDGFCCECTEGGKLLRTVLSSCPTGQMRMAYQQENGGEATLSASKVGLYLYSNNYAGPGNTFHIDYFRRRAAHDFYGLAT